MEVEKPGQKPAPCGMDDDFTCYAATPGPCDLDLCIYPPEQYRCPPWYPLNLEKCDLHCPQLPTPGQVVLKSHPFQVLACGLNHGSHLGKVFCLPASASSFVEGVRPIPLPKVAMRIKCVNE